MGKLPSLLPVSNLRSDAAGVIKRLQKSDDGLAIITQRGKTAAVLLSVDAYERTQKSEHDRQLLLRLLRGQREVAQGKGKNLDQVMKEIDDLLEGGE